MEKKCSLCKEIKASNEFYTISKIKELRHIGALRTFILIGGLFTVIALNVLGVGKLFTGLLVLLILTQLFKIVSPKELAKSVDYQLALIIALSLALGLAMIKTGVADILANGVLYIFDHIFCDKFVDIWVFLKFFVLNTINNNFRTFSDLSFLTRYFKFFYMFFT